MKYYINQEGEPLNSHLYTFDEVLNYFRRDFDPDSEFLNPEDKEKEIEHLKDFENIKDLDNLIDWLKVDYSGYRIPWHIEEAF
jgi:hypothetical protein